MNASPHVSLYWQYLQVACPSIAPDSLPLIRTALETTNWEEPQSPLEWNNYGVIALIAAEQATDLDRRRLYIEKAIAAFANSAKDHPLCAAHLALVYSLIGEQQNANQIALHTFTQTMQAVYVEDDRTSAGLVYLPTIAMQTTPDQSQWLTQMVQSESSVRQAFELLGDILSHQLQTLFYNEVGLRFMHLAVHLMPQSAFNNLLLGIASHINNQWEGLLYLHRARALQPDRPSNVQTLYLAYRDREDEHLARFWLEEASRQRATATHDHGWQWVGLGSDRPFTYSPYDNLLLTVRASLLNITTCVLLAKGDWFEAELEFWRNQIQPGMTVIDVGANVGIYTFSAAQRVGETGYVLAVEPFSDCVQCLQETCRVNQFSWVSVIAGAASDRNGTAQLALHSASELNRLVSAETVSLESEKTEESEETTTVACFTLDHLMEQAAIAQVDFLKIDAEGHELQVLIGSEKILTECLPTIIYENLESSHAANLDAAEFLQAKGYQLFYYVPYLQGLARIQKISDLQKNLNIVAIHASNV